MKTYYRIPKDKMPDVRDLLRVAPRLVYWEDPFNFITRAINAVPSGDGSSFLLELEDSELEALPVATKTEIKKLRKLTSDEKKAIQGSVEFDPANGWEEVAGDILLLATGKSKGIRREDIDPHLLYSALISRGVPVTEAAQMRDSLKEKS